jgi:hypothetical protein
MCGSRQKKERSEVLWEVEFGSRSENTYLCSGKGYDNLRTLKERIGQTKLNLKIKVTKLSLYLLYWRTYGYRGEWQSFIR